MTRSGAVKRSKARVGRGCVFSGTIRAHLIEEVCSEKRHGLTAAANITSHSQVARCFTTQPSIEFQKSVYGCAVL